MSTGVRRVVLADLSPGMNNALIVGIIIATQNPRTITMKTDMSLRGVWNFTLRDSETDFINANLWGSPDFVNSCADQFHIGDVVAVTCAKVSFRNTSGTNENYRPVVSSPFELSLTENISEVEHHVLPDAESFKYLLHLPTKESLDFVTLKDIQSSGSMMEGTFINVLVAVRSVLPVRQIQSKDGRQLECREVTVFDQTSRELSLQMWDHEIIVQAALWKPRETILFIADLRLTWNSFKKSVIPSFTSRTVLTVDPYTPEAECLRVYADAAILHPSALIDHLSSNQIDISSIRNVLSVQAVLVKAWADVHAYQIEEEEQFTALTYAVITQCDLNHENAVISRCGSCKKQADQEMHTCKNMECPVGQGVETENMQRIFNIRVNLTDHTGTLKNCRLVGETAAAVLQCMEPEFDEMSDDQKRSLSWNFLFERCAVHILVLKATHQRRQPYISVLACSVADLAEVASRMPTM